MALCFDLPMPPSTNRIWRSVRGRVVKSKTYKNWLVEAGKEVQAEIGKKKVKPLRPTVRSTDLLSLKVVPCDVLEEVVRFDLFCVLRSTSQPLRRVLD